MQGKKLALTANSENKGTSSSGQKYVYSQLEFPSAELDDSGEYICTVRNHMGQTNNASVVISVLGGELFPPKYLQK